MYFIALNIYKRLLFFVNLKIHKDCLILDFDQNMLMCVFALLIVFFRFSCWLLAHRCAHKELRLPLSFLRTSNRRDQDAASGWWQGEHHSLSLMLSYKCRWYCFHWHSFSLSEINLNLFDNEPHALRWNGCWVSLQKTTKGWVYVRQVRVSLIQ